MTLQEAQRRFFLQQLGEVSGALPDLAVAYYKAMLDGTISPGGEVGSADITDATAVGRAVLTAATAAAGRTAIGAGTSNLVVGTGATNAKAGNYVPTYAEVTGKPATFPPTIGTTATTAKAGDYTPTVAGVTGLQEALDLKATAAALALLEARVAALETPAG